MYILSRLFKVIQLTKGVECITCNENNEGLVKFDIDLYKKGSLIGGSEDVIFGFVISSYPEIYDFNYVQEIRIGKLSRREEENDKVSYISIGLVSSDIYSRYMYKKQNKN